MKRKTIKLSEFKNITSPIEVKEVFNGFALVADLYPVAIFKSETYNTPEQVTKAAKEAGIDL